MEESPSEANSRSASQEIPLLLWNPKIHYRVYKSPQMVPILSQMNPFHIFPPYLINIHFNIIFQPVPRYSSFSTVRVSVEVDGASLLFLWAISCSRIHTTLPQFPILVAYVFYMNSRY